MFFSCHLPPACHAVAQQSVGGTPETFFLLLTPPTVLITPLSCFRTYVPLCLAVVIDMLTITATASIMFINLFVFIFTSLISIQRLGSGAN
jgi:hypothetical protein